MTVKASTHPAPDRLAAFGLGKLSGPEADTVAQHLESCTTCQDTASRMPPDGFLNLLRAAHAGAGAAPPVGSFHAPDTRGEASRAAGPSAAGPQALPTLPPELTKKYRILKELGRGGMGVVYQAEHIQMERLVAIKVINKSVLNNPTATQRFAQEVKAAARLNHPNIVAAYDFEQAGDLHMLVMEYVEGRNLAEVLQSSGPLPIAQACLYVRQAAQGLHHAFQLKMIHRDLKPHNLMLTPHGTIKVLDLGLARRTSDGPQQPGMTGAGAVIGTPEYIAPEQALDASKVDIRADIYSLGCTLYQLLTGKPPFPDGTPMQKLLAHVEKEAPPVRQLRADVPAELSAVVAKMMAKKPEERYQTPAEVMGALAPFCKAGPPTMDGKAGKPRPASRIKRWAAVAAALVLVAGGILAAQMVIRIRHPDGKETEVSAPAGSRVEINPKGEAKVTLPPASTGKTEPKPVADGFVSLFNGKDLTGWKTHPRQRGNWSAENGILVGRGPAISHLYSERGDYENVHFRTEVRINAGGDSGQYVRASFGPRKGEVWPTGYEAQIGGPGCLLIGESNAPAVSYPGPRWLSAVWAARWTTHEVIAVGNRITVKIDGREVFSWTDPKRRFSRGHLALQVGNERGTVVEFRKLEVKELPTTPEREG